MYYNILCADAALDREVDALGLLLQRLLGELVITTILVIVIVNMIKKYSYYYYYYY